MKAQVLHSQASVLFEDRPDLRRQTSRDVIVRVSRAGLRGSDLRLHRRAIGQPERLVRRDQLMRVVEEPRSAGLIALIRLAGLTQLRRAHVPLREVLFGASRRSGRADALRDRAASYEELRHGRWLDELRAHDRIEELLEWLLRGQPRADEVVGERLTLAETAYAEEMFEATENSGVRVVRDPFA